MKKVSVFVCLSLSVLLLTSLAKAQNPRELLNGEFAGMETTIVYRDDASNALREERYVSKIGRLKRGARAVPMSNLSTADTNTIPGAGLMAEHWWLSFELLMLAQREYAECVAVVNFILQKKGACEIDDVRCSSLATTVQVIRDYWVPFNIVFDGGVPGRITYRDHLDAGISSLNQALYHRDLCESYLTSISHLVR